MTRSGHFHRTCDATLANVGLSVLLCLTAVIAGHGLAAQFNGGAVQVAQTQTEEEAS